MSVTTRDYCATCGQAAPKAHTLLGWEHVKRGGATVFLCPNCNPKPIKRTKKRAKK